MYKCWWRNPWWSIVLPLIFLAWLGVGLLPTYIFGFGKNAGEYGDQFGFVNSLFSALAFFAVAYTLYLQTKELASQREQTEEQSRLMFLAAYLDSLNTQIRSYDEQLKEARSDKEMKEKDRSRIRRRRRPVRDEVEDIVHFLRPDAEGQLGRNGVPLRKNYVESYLMSFYDEWRRYARAGKNTDVHRFFEFSVKDINRRIKEWTYRRYPSEAIDQAKRIRDFIIEFTEREEYLVERIDKSRPEGEPTQEELRAKLDAFHAELKRKIGPRSLPSDDDE